MKLKNLITTAFLLIISTMAFAQVGGVIGRIVDRANRQPIVGATVTLTTPEGEVTTTTEAKGIFKFENIADGRYDVIVKADQYIDNRLNVYVKGGIKDMMDITMTASIQDNDLDDDLFAEFDSSNEAGFEDLPSVLSSSKDIYDNVAGYKFGAMRFLSRGYESGTSDVYINGVRFNDANTGYTPWSLFSGLNEATRNKSVSDGMAIAENGNGGINGVTEVNAYASEVRKGLHTSFLTSNSFYRWRFMVTYASGELDNGWSYAFSGSTRQGGNDYMQGVKYNSFAYYAGVEKNINDTHNFSFTFMGSPTVRGVMGASTQEVYDLMGTNYYNPNWGYQGGTSDSDIRTSREKNIHEPLAIFNYKYTPNESFKLTANVAYRFGKYAYSSLSWYDTSDPRPDYYRNLPSYFSDDPVKAGWVKEGWKTDESIRHLDWNRMYNVNYNSYLDKDAQDYTYESGINSTGDLLRSKYIIGDRRTDQKDLITSLKIDKTFNAKLSGTFGYNFRHNDTENYMVVNDLLGGDCWVDIDQYAERDFTSNDAIQSDLNNPNRVVKEGDKFSYDYYAHIRNHNLWGNATYVITSKLNTTLAAGIGYNTFWREGKYKKGLFPDDSYGDSEKENFFTYNAKLALNYSFLGQNRLYANIGYRSDSPYFRDSYLSARTRNTVASNLENKKTFSADINFSGKILGATVRASAYYTTIEDQMDLISFYDDIQRSFTNMSLSNINQRNIGIELGYDIPVPYVTGLSVQGALSLGKYVYTSNANMTQTVDNSNLIIHENAKVRWDGYRVPSTPQIASNIGLAYRTPGYLFLNLDVSYFDKMYLSMNPMRRTDFAVAGIDYTAQPELYNNMVAQEEFDPAVVVNASVGKSWYIQRKYNVGVNLSVNNILNSQDIKTGGYEQMRIKKQDDGSYKPFDSKYFYMFGTTYMLNVYFRF